MAEGMWWRGEREREPVLWILSFFPFVPFVPPDARLPGAAHIQCGSPLLIGTLILFYGMECCPILE
jgi:hypothetical protein